MSGDVSNVNLWPDADVYVAPLATPDPANASTPFAVSWQHVGLLDGDAGFVESREEDEETAFAWGGIELPTNSRNFSLAVTFTGWELNATTFSLLWPGSTSTELVVPRPELVKIAFETRNGSRVQRKISKYGALVKLDGDLTEDEATPTSYSFRARIFADASTSPPVIWTLQDTQLTSS